MKALSKILLIIVLIFGATQSFAQVAPAAKYDSIYKTGLIDAEIIIHNEITNNSSSAQTFRWILNSVSMSSGWDFALCDPTQCYTETDSADFPLEAGATGLFDAHFVPNNIKGYGKAVFTLFPVNARDKSIKIIFYCDGTSSIVIPEKQIPGPVTFTMYPSPIRDYLNIKFSQKGTHVVEIYTILGNKVMSRETNNTDYLKFSFLDLQPGMYVVRCRPENGKLITKTISKE